MMMRHNIKRFIKERKELLQAADLFESLDIQFDKNDLNDAVDNINQDIIRFKKMGR